MLDFITNFIFRKDLDNVIFTRIFCGDFTMKL